MRQKNVTEIILLVLLIAFISALENSLLSVMPFYLGRFHILHIVIFYLALTRSWGRLSLLSLFFAYAASANSGTHTGSHVATLMWAAYLVKLTSYTLSFENRYSFVSLAFISHFFVQIGLWVLTQFSGKTIPFWELLVELPGSMVGVSIAAYLLYPVMVKWDQVFEHEAEDARDFNPSI